MRYRCCGLTLVGSTELKKHVESDVHKNRLTKKAEVNEGSVTRGQNKRKSLSSTSSGFSEESDKGSAVDSDTPSSSPRKLRRSNGTETKASRDQQQNGRIHEGVNGEKTAVKKKVGRPAKMPTNVAHRKASNLMTSYKKQLGQLVDNVVSSTTPASSPVISEDPWKEKFERLHEDFVRLSESLERHRSEEKERTASIDEAKRDLQLLQGKLTTLIEVEKKNELEIGAKTEEIFKLKIQLEQSMNLCIERKKKIALQTEELNTTKTELERLREKAKENEKLEVNYKLLVNFKSEDIAKLESVLKYKDKQLEEVTKVRDNYLSKSKPLEDKVKLLEGIVDQTQDLLANKLAEIYELKNKLKIARGLKTETKNDIVS